MRRALLLAVVALLAIQAAPVQGASGVPPVNVPADAWYLVGEDGSVWAGRNEREPRAIASITKLMTAVVAIEETRLSEVVTVPSQAGSIGGSTAYLRPGERVSVSDLLRSLLVASGNDAAQTLALHVGRGSVDRFVGLMNDKARELGLDETTFVNPHGLDEPGHLSSAEDATLLVRYALGIPFVRDALGRTSVTSPSGRSVPSTDDLVESWKPLLGGKTGHTASAGWSEAGAARARGVTVFGTVLGADSRTARNQALRRLLTFGLARYRRVAAIDAGVVYALAETGYGRSSVELVAPRTLVRTVSERTPLLQRVVAPSAVGLPVRQGQRLGRIEIWDRDRLVASSNLVAATSISEPGLVGKAAWFAQRTAENLWGLVT